jgi:hypothetical protein
MERADVPIRRIGTQQSEIRSNAVQSAAALHYCPIYRTRREVMRMIALMIIQACLTTVSIVLQIVSIFIAKKTAKADKL